MFFHSFESLFFLSYVSQMYSEGSEFLPQNNETALQYFKKSSDLVRIEIKQYIKDLFYIKVLI